MRTQNRADERIPVLLQIPAAVRFVSIEPMLGPVDLQNVDFNGSTGLCTLDKGSGGIHWVIVGAETGPRKRKMKAEWAQNVRAQCESAKVPFFFKKDSWGCHTFDGREWNDYPTIGGSR